MEIVPVSIEHATQFGAIIESIASEEQFPIEWDSVSQVTALRFVERHLVDGAPMFVAFKQDKLVGWCEISMSELDYCKHSGLLSMGILNGYRGQGLGSWLINKCTVAARSMGFERIELSVLESNVYAQTFYKHKGFEVEGRKNRSLKMGSKYFSEVLMAKHINDIPIGARYCQLR